MVFEGFLTSLANTLGIPLGAKMRKYTNDSSKDTSEIVETLDDSLIKDFINSIIDITKDDVCVGEAPMFYQSQRKRLSNKLKSACQNVCDAFNRIASWVAFDLLKSGISVYTYDVVDGKVIFTPYLDSVTLYLRRDLTIKVVDSETSQEIKNGLVFAYYDKSMLEKVDECEDEEVKGYLRIKPQGIQTKNLLQAANSLIKCEQSIERLRAQTSKVIRFASVEIGVNSGDKAQNVVDDVSEGLNANSEDLVSTTDFDDQIPVFPTRKGMGRPEYQEHYSQANLSDLADLDYNLSKAFLAMRFPKSYADFSTNLTPTAVSMIRGDIRYAKLLLTARSLIERTFNEFVSGIPEVKKNEIEFKLTQVPSSEDDDLVTILTTYNDYANSAADYLLAAETKEEALARLESLRVLYSTSTNTEGVEKWASAMTSVIEAKYKEGATEFEPEEFGEDTGDIESEFPQDEEI